VKEDKIFIVEEYMLCKMDYIVEANNAKDAANKFAKGEFYSFGNTPEEVATSGISLRKANDHDEADPLYLRAMKEISDEKLPEEEVVVKKKRGRPRKDGN